MVVLEGVAVSYERGDPVALAGPCQSLMVAFQKSFRPARQQLAKVKSLRCDAPKESHPIRQSGVVGADHPMRLPLHDESMLVLAMRLSLHQICGVAITSPPGKWGGA